MSKLDELNKEFKKYRDSGYNQYESAKRAVDEVFTGITVKPHIYQDKDENASHVFFEKQVLFFNGSIYNEELQKNSIQTLKLISPLHIELVESGNGEFPDTYELTEKGINKIQGLIDYEKR